MIQETEVKIAISGVEEARARIEACGFAEVRARVFERNLVFDSPDGGLRKGKQLLRLRDAGGLATLTYKGVPRTGGKHKSREERETAVGAFAEMQVILERLGYQVRFIYEKFRTEFGVAGENGTITVDETPIGNFLELEGEADWIDATARRLRYSERDYLLGSYGGLYGAWCWERGVEPGDMRFAKAEALPHTFL